MYPWKKTLRSCPFNGNGHLLSLKFDWLEKEMNHTRLSLEGNWGHNLRYAWLVPKICIKYRKHGRYFFSSKIDCRCLWYFETKKDILKPKLTSFPLLYQSAVRTLHTANIFDVIFTVFNCVRLSTVISLYGLHLIAAPSTTE